MPFGSGNSVGEMFVDIGSVHCRPSDEVVVLNGTEPCRGNRGEASGM